MDTVSPTNVYDNTKLRHPHKTCLATAAVPDRRASLSED